MVKELDNVNDSNNDGDDIDDVNDGFNVFVCCRVLLFVRWSLMMRKNLVLCALVCCCLVQSLFNYCSVVRFVGCS